MRKTRPVIGVTAVALVVASVVVGQAQNSTNGTPPSARKEGGTEGDPNGAIRAMGGTESTGFERKGTVTVPKLGAFGKDETRHRPAGTGGPSR